MARLKVVCADSAQFMEALSAANQQEQEVSRSAMM